MTVIEKQVISSSLDEETLQYLADKPEDRDEAEMRVAASKMLSLIQNKRDNPPPPKGVNLRREICKAFSIPEELMFARTRKREVVNARQTYIFLLVTTDVVNKRIIPLSETKWRRADGKVDPAMGSRDRPSFLARHIGWDHATIYNSCRVTWDYYQTEKFYRELIDKLQMCLLGGLITMPDIKDPVK